MPASPLTISGRRTLLQGLAAIGSLAAVTLAGCGFVGPAPRSSSDMASRRVFARHLYNRYPGRIYAGKLPPMLYAVGTLEVYLAGNGQVRGMHWMRAPTHAPEVMQEIETMVRSAAPFPAPGGMGARWVDTWLWDNSGRFQLDSLTEGQLRHED